MEEHVIPARNTIHLLPAQEMDLSRIRQSPPGLVLVIGKTASMRTAFLEWLVDDLSKDAHIRLSVIALPDGFSAPSECLVPVPPRGDRLLSGLRYALDADPDQIVLDLVEGQEDPELSRLATDAARWGIGVWAGVQGTDPARTLSRLVASCLDRITPSTNGVLRGIICLRELPRLCRSCAAPPRDRARRDALTRLLGDAAPGAYSRGPGCALCNLGIDGAEALVEICPILSGHDMSAPAEDWDTLRANWLRTGGVCHLRHALWHVGQGRGDLAGVREVFGPLKATQNTLQILLRQVKDDLAATTKDDPS